MKKVLIIQRIIPSYRVPFYKDLERSLSKSNVSLDIVAGQPWKKEAFSDYRKKLDFIVMSKNIPLFGSLYWQTNVIKLIHKYDLVIFEQANSALVNIFIFFRRYIYGKPLIAFWGHGAHLNKVRRNQFKDKWKSFLTTKVDHWFAYTALTERILVEKGVKLEKISNICNTIDTDALRNYAKSISSESIEDLFFNLFGYRRDSNTKIGVFCARLAPLKEIDFLLTSLKKIREECKEFHFLIIGDGIESHKVKDFVAENSWCKWLGSLYSEEKVKYILLSDCWLNPGMTGLSILDSFALGKPFITQNSGIHSPEIEYLVHGFNGLLTDTGIKSYTEQVVKLLNSSDLKNYSDNAYNDGLKYNIDRMVCNYVAGITRVLDHENYPNS